LLAFQIEIALDKESSVSQRLTSKAHINALLAYFRDAGNNWQIASWTYKVCDWVVKRADLKMQSDSKTFTAMEQAQHSRDWGVDQAQTGTFSSSEVPLAPFFHNNLAFGDTLPEHWFEDFFGESHYAQLNTDFGSFNRVD
jgi:hypothetical protein